MNTEIQENSENPVDVSTSYIQAPYAEPESIYISDVYRPSDGTFAEFVGDAKLALAKVGRDITERIEDARESIGKLLHRRSPSAPSNNSRMVYH